ncbi:hypothetical protein [Thermovenabulum sp.]|uniref:hypothetical protein n=1 Tax=Thermovenabulum sp. TaxID=3100335 RepID=UPI003C7E9FF5
MVFLDLNLDVRYLKGVGPARAKLLKALDIKTVKDLLFFFSKGLYRSHPHEIEGSDRRSKNHFFS